MNALPPAPDRAQRVRGIPGVGLRTADGTEWVKVGKVFAEIGGVDTIRVHDCTRPGRYGNPYRVVQNERGTYVVMLGAVVTDDGTGSWGGTGSWWTPFPERDEAQVREHTKKLANASAIISFANRVMCDWPDAMFHDLAKFDYLSCFCPLDRPCHVDAIIVEGARRGMWGGG